MGEKKIDCQPAVAGFFKTIANGVFNWKKVLCEVIDNSFDKNAKNIDILIVNRDKVKHLEIRDDGHGCEDMTAFCTYGLSISAKTTELGRYGCGVKQFQGLACGAESVMHVESVHGGFHRTIAVDWKRMSIENKFEVYEPRVRKALSGEAGTTIRVSPLQRTFLAGRQLDDLIQDLSFTYQKRIREGATIKLHSGDNVYTVPEFKHPEFDKDYMMIRKRVTLGDKKIRANITCGFVPPGVPNRYPGMSYAAGFRVISAKSTDGMKGHNADRFFGYVEFEKDVPLTNDKSEFIYNEWFTKDLYDEIYVFCERIITHAHAKVATDAEVSCFDYAKDILKKAIQDQFGATQKARRIGENPRPKRSSAGKPTGEGTKHSGAEVVQEGQTFTSLELFCGTNPDPANHSLGVTAGGFGSPLKAVYLYKDHPAIKRCIENKDSRMLATFALNAAVNAITTDHKPETDDKTLLRTLGEALFPLYEATAKNT